MKIITTFKYIITCQYLSIVILADVLMVLKISRKMLQNASVYELGTE